MNDKRTSNAGPIQRLADVALGNGLVVSVAPFDDRGAALVITDPLDASGSTPLMPARLAAALLELIEGEPVPSFQEAFELLQFERECLPDLDRIIEAAR